MTEPLAGVLVVCANSVTVFWLYKAVCAKALSFCAFTLATLAGNTVDVVYVICAVCAVFCAVWLGNSVDTR